MNIHEYQAKDILDSFGVPVPKGGVAKTPEEAEALAKELNVGLYVVKAQIHAGGRGKGGGVKLAKTPAEVRERADEILGMQLITHQTGPEGKMVRQVLVAEASDIKNELYLGLVIDRETSRITLMASEEGGVDIEKVAEETPEKIVKQSVDPAVGLQAFQARQLAFGLNLPDEVIRPATSLIIDVYRAFVECDCSLMEINPLAIVSGERGAEVLALDAKINFDDNALYRQSKIGMLRDKNEEDARELEAKESGLSYISLDGNGSIQARRKSRIHPRRARQ